MKANKRQSTWRIYCVTNAVNGKRYVGVTRYGAGHRLHVHRSTAKGGGRGAPLLCKAIRKYGPEAFSVEVLEDGLMLGQAASAAERRWIRNLRTLAPRGYNLDLGGYGGADMAGPERRRKLSLALRGRRHSAERCARIGAALLESHRLAREAREVTFEGCPAVVALRKRIRQCDRPLKLWPSRKDWTERPLWPYLARLAGGSEALRARSSVARRQAGAAQRKPRLLGMQAYYLRRALDAWIDAGRRAARLSFGWGHEGLWAPHSHRRKAA